MGTRESYGNSSGFNLEVIGKNKKKERPTKQKDEHLSGVLRKADQKPNNVMFSNGQQITPIKTTDGCTSGTSSMQFPKSGRPSVEFASRPSDERKSTSSLFSETDMKNIQARLQNKTTETPTPQQTS